MPLWWLPKLEAYIHLHSVNNMYRLDDEVHKTYWSVVANKVITHLWVNPVILWGFTKLAITYNSYVLCVKIHKFLNKQWPRQNHWWSNNEPLLTFITCLIFCCLIICWVCNTYWTLPNRKNLTITFIIISPWCTREGQGRRGASHDGGWIQDRIDVRRMMSVLP